MQNTSFQKRVSSLTNLLPLLLGIWIVRDSRFKLLSACNQIGSIEIRVSRFLYTIFWAETRHETDTRNKKLVFSSLVSPIRLTFYEFRKRETPKLVFYPTIKKWPKYKSRVFGEAGSDVEFWWECLVNIRDEKTGETLFSSRMFEWRSNQNETSRHARSKSSGFYFWRGYSHNLTHS